MAQILLAGGSGTAINGSRNGITFYRTRWGNITRKAVIPTDVITPERTAVRSLFTSIQSLYSSLTPDMQAEWSDLAHGIIHSNRVGITYREAGKSLFTEWNINLGILSQPPIIAARQAGKVDHIRILAPGESTLIKLHVDIEGYDNTINLAPDQYVTISSSTPHSAHSRNNSQHYRIIRKLSPGDALSQDLITDYNAAWPGNPLVAGMRIFYRAHFVNGDTGNATAPAYASALIT